MKITEWPEHEDATPFAIAYFDEDGRVTDIGCVAIGEPDPNVTYEITTERPPEITYHFASDEP